MASLTYRIETVSAAEVAKYLPHPTAAKYPRPTKEKLAILRADMLENGQLQPLVVCNGLLIDGLTRRETGMETYMVKFCEDVPEDRIEGMIRSLNNHRRHMSVKVIADMALAYYDSEKEAGRPITLSEAAAAFQVSLRSMHRRNEIQRRQAADKGKSETRLRTPNELMDMQVLLPYLSKYKKTEGGKWFYNRYWARIQELANELLSQPELEAARIRCNAIRARRSMGP